MPYSTLVTTHAELTTFAQAPANDTVQIPASAVAAISVAVVGTLIGTACKFVIDQALRRWKDKIDELQKDLTRLESVVDRVPTVQQMGVFDQRLGNLGGALQQAQQLFQDTQRDLIKLRGELSTEYVRREDWIRFANTLEAKMDGLKRNLDDKFDSLQGRIK